MKIETLVVGPLGTNCYLLCDEQAGVCAVIDPGAETTRIAGRIAELGYTLSAILLTHGHSDHTGGVAKMQEKFPGVPVYISGKESLGIGRIFPALEGCTFYDEGDTVQVGGLTIQDLATPGHSLGSVTLLVEDAMFSGDTLFSGSCGRSDFYGGDQNTLLASLARLGRLEGEYRVLPGHMDASTLSAERSFNPALRYALQRI